MVKDFSFCVIGSVLSAFRFEHETAGGCKLILLSGSLFLDTFNKYNEDATFKVARDVKASWR